MPSTAEIKRAAPAPAREYFSETKIKLDFDRVMESDVGAQAMLEFATSMMSEENCSFWIEATRWRRSCYEKGNVAGAPATTIIDDPEACARADEIIRVSLRPSTATKPVNLPDHITQAFTAEPSSYTIGMFDAAIRECRSLVKNDTFELFCRSASGQALAQSHTDLW